MIVGLTGAIGSGKSSAANCFHANDVPVFDADKIARDLSAPGEAGYQGIVAHFGDACLDDNGALDRDKLRDIIFADSRQRAAIDQIIHPLVFDELQRLSEARDTPYCIWDVPLLIGKAEQHQVDRILVINAPLENRKAWIQARSGWDSAMIEAVMANQPAPESLLAEADDVLHNLGDLATLCGQVDALHRHYLALVPG